MSKQVVLEFPVEFPEKSVPDKEVLRKMKELMVWSICEKGRYPKERQPSF